MKIENQNRGTLQAIPSSNVSIDKKANEKLKPVEDGMYFSITPEDLKHFVELSKRVDEKQENKEYLKDLERNSEFSFNVESFASKILGETQHAE